MSSMEQHTILALNLPSKARSLGASLAAGEPLSLGRVARLTPPCRISLTWRVFTTFYHWELLRILCGLRHKNFGKDPEWLIAYHKIWVVFT